MFLNRERLDLWIAGVVGRVAYLKAKSESKIPGFPKFVWAFLAHGVAIVHRPGVPVSGMGAVAVESFTINNLIAEEKPWIVHLIFQQIKAYGCIVHARAWGRVEAVEIEVVKGRG
jgi:hypothetical protein